MLMTSAITIHISCRASPDHDVAPLRAGSGGADAMRIVGEEPRRKRHAQRYGAQSPAEAHATRMERAVQQNSRAA